MSEIKKDQIFSRQLDEIAKFKFGNEVANVFDDMVNRSIPFYQEIHHILLDILKRYQLPKNHDDSLAPIYDLGCSTSETLITIARSGYLGDLIGIDNSEAMIEKSKQKIAQILPEEKGKQIQLYCDDLRNTSAKYWSNASMIIMNYTLQFVPLQDRDELLRNIYGRLHEGGIFFLAEKVQTPAKKIEGLVTELYYDFKRRNGYSELEISQKRQALEDVLVPVSSQRQIAMLREAGFQDVEMIFRWYNFACYIGIK